MIERRARARKSQAGKAAGKALAYGARLMARLDALAAFTEVPGQLTRRYLTPAHVAAMGQVRAWMEEAGMRVRVDPLCSVFGRYEGHALDAPAILLGSHIDTVVDAGKYDGNLGVLAAIAAVADMAQRGERLGHAIEVAAFGEEEGSRFPTHILTSSALTGVVEPALLDMQDGDGISVREALAVAGGDAKAYRACARRNGDIAAYLELHIEQGPVLDDKGLALGAVTAINGSVRFRITVSGFAGHAGTVPMGSRRDALAAASEMILAIETLATATPDLVATVGRIKALPGASNVIPGRVEFSIDLRSPSDAVRRRAAKALLPSLREIAGRRHVDVESETYQENPAVALDTDVVDTVAEAIAACGHQPMRLASGAGHDAMIMAKLCPSGMIFLRCKDGISHNPAESITVEDADVGVRVLLETVRRVDRRLQRRS
jgi:hydantoinase/carbamoylase family amidase